MYKLNVDFNSKYIYIYNENIKTMSENIRIRKFNQFVTLHEAKTELRLTTGKLETIAEYNNLSFKYIHNTDGDFLVIILKPFVTAFFKLNDVDINAVYSHTYDARTDKITKYLPYILKKFYENVI